MKVTILDRDKDYLLFYGDMDRVPCKDEYVIIDDVHYTVASVATRQVMHKTFEGKLYPLGWEYSVTVHVANRMLYAPKKDQSVGLTPS